MKFNPNVHHRRSIRLKGYAYSQAGAYFVTIGTCHQGCVLVMVVDGTVQLSSEGQIVFDFWSEVSTHFPHVEVGTFVIMPNHVHAIIIINDPRRGGVTPPLREDVNPSSPPNLGNIVAYYKYQTTKMINALNGSPGSPFWQRNYYEHIIRNESEWEKIRDYILTNPLHWKEDQLHPNGIM